MIDLIFFVIFILSLGGVLLILARKIPVLASLPQNGKTGIKKHRVIVEAENKVKGIFEFFEKQILLHRLLSWVKIMTLKIETKVDHRLHNIRKKAQKKAGKDKK
jgi:hypothetical protein